MDLLLSELLHNNATIAPPLLNIDRVFAAATHNVQVTIIRYEAIRIRSDYGGYVIQTSTRQTVEDNG